MRGQTADASVLQRPVADLGAQVEDDDLDRADIRLHGGDAFFDAVWLAGIEQEARCRSAFPLDGLHQLGEAFLVAASTQDSVIAFSGESLADVASDAGARADDQAGILHGSVTPTRIW
jgi:hypothetical protein